jgi:8-oxo-dGTP diphosphatase
VAEIRLRACIAVVDKGQILLVPHFQTDAGPIQWVVPGGGVEFGESLHAAATREFKEETGFDAEIDELLDTFEVIHPARPWHSVTIAFRGHIVRGHPHSEETPWGLRTARWFSLMELHDQPYHPPEIVQKALQ